TPVGGVRKDTYMARVRDLPLYGHPHEPPLKQRRRRATMPVSPSTNQQPRAQLTRVLRLPAIVLFGLTYMSPVAVFTTYRIVDEQTRGHLPAAYVLALAVMMLTAHSYGRMVRAFPEAGSAYKYAQRAFGGHVGFLTGWALMLDYLFLPMISFLLAGIYLHAQ